MAIAQIKASKTDSKKKTSVKARPTISTAPRLVQQKQQSEIRGILNSPQLQPKLKIGTPGDLYEKEADRIATEIAGPSSGGGKHAATAFGDVDHKNVEQILSNPTGGSSLPAPVLMTMQNSLGYDFSGVKVHQGVKDQKATQAMGARAMTLGNHIWLAPGESSKDLKLMAHELVHVVQQRSAPVVEGEERSVEVTSSEPQVQRESNVEWLWNNTGGAVVDAGASVIEAGGDALWSLVKKVAPAALISLIEEVREKGFFGFLKEKLTAAADKILEGLGGDQTLLGSLFSTYINLISSTSEIIGALAEGCCEPLFAAVETLKNNISKMAGEAWNAIKNFFKPIGDFFSDMWASFGAPVLDWLKTTATDTWKYIKDLGAQIWSWTQPVRDTVGGAWDWVKDKLGLGGESTDTSSEGGIMSWVNSKASEAWTSLKEEMAPVMEPVQGVVDKVKEVLPLEAIFNLRDTVQGWLGKINDMSGSMKEGQVAEEQVSLRDEILPAVLQRITELQAGMISTGTWVSEKVGALAGTITGFVGKVRSSPVFGHLAVGLKWLEDLAIQLADWIQTGVIALFDKVAEGLGFLAAWITPIFNLLMKIVDTITDLVGKIPDLILGPIWRLVPECIRDPLQDFIMNQIIARIPLISQFVALGDLWAKIKNTALTILKRLFVDGDILGALWLYFSSILTIFGIPPDLVVNILANASQAFSDIIGNPVGFIINILKSLKLGFVNFFGNVLSHLFGGVVDWLFGGLREAGVEPPKDFTLSSVLKFVLDVLGLSMQKIFEKLADKIGQDNVEKFKKAIDVATGVWEWISILIKEGPAGLWVKIKEKITGLWGMVIEKVVGYLSSVVMVQASKWLLSLCDISGVTAVINGIIAIYKAIESAMEYFKAMLEIVNTIVSGIADIAKGQITGAAAYVESAMAKGIPIVVGFLANQLGLGNLGKKIGEIIAGIRETIDKAIGWLIDNALKLGKSILDMIKAGGKTVKGGVKKLTEWWKNRKKFKARDGQSHTLFYEKRGNKITPMMASEVKPVEERVKEAEQGDDSVAKTAAKKARAELAVSEQANKDGQAFEDTTLLAALTDITPSKGKTGGDVKVGDVTVTPQVNYTSGTLNLGGKSDVVGQSMEAVYLGKNHPKGSGPGTSQSNIFSVIPTKGDVDKINGASRDANSIYIKGHLLNDNLGGPGEGRNLFPITQQANRLHESNIEKDAKRLVNDEGFIVHYLVKVPYYKLQPTTVIKGTTFHPVNANFYCQLSTYEKQGDKLVKKSPFKTVTIQSIYKTDPLASGSSAVGPSDSTAKGTQDVTGAKLDDHEKIKAEVMHRGGGSGKVKINVVNRDKFLTLNKDKIVKELKKVQGVGAIKAGEAYTSIVQEKDLLGVGSDIIAAMEVQINAYVNSATTPTV